MNRLAGEQSPYLRQHAENPVDWYPWGEEAAARARREDRPVFLSIGYSACHWCHVMAHESFEDEETAALLNAHFVSVKVDREERPDLDAFYMRSVQLMAGQGGWPLSVFLTPSLKPFFGGTYFPPRPAFGRPSFRQVLRGVLRAFRENRDEIERSADGVAVAVARTFLEAPSGPPPGRTARRAAAEELLSRLDPVEGGFGRGPKFPQPPLLRFLLEASLREGRPQWAEQVFFALEKMASGGIRDHLAGGFHRYSVDGAWRVPHYEKMLYDNALLASLYAEAHRHAPGRCFLEVAEGILWDLERSFLSPAGLFRAALDADSEGEEGRYYLFGAAEVRKALGDPWGDRVAEIFGLGDGESLEERTLHRTLSDGEAALRYGEEPEAFRRGLRGALARLLEFRERRPAPAADVKLLTDWNALAASAFLDGYGATGEERYLQRALGVLEALDRLAFLRGRLYHVAGTGKDGPAGFLADHAFLAEASLRAFSLTGQKAHLERASRLLETIARNFFDHESGLLFDTPLAGGDPLRPLPVRDPSDGVLPSAQGAAVRGALWLGTAAGREDLLLLARRVCEGEAGTLAAEPASAPALADLAARLEEESTTVVVSAPAPGPEASALLLAAWRAAPPGAVVVPNWSSEWSPQEAKALPLLEGRRASGAPMAFVCRGGTCLPPVAEAGEVEALLRGH
ncbi:MAG: thioredoxin domain-containing protein [Acidobacteriota bacterium]